MGDHTNEEIEKEIQAKGLNAPRLTPTHIEEQIKEETYTILPSGRTTICELTLRNGFTVRGESSVVSKANFNEELGRKISRDDAKRKIWAFEAYRLTEQLHSQSTASQTSV